MSTAITPKVPGFGGAAPLTVAAATVQTQATRITATMAHPTPAGPAGIPIYAWTWLRQPGAATFSNTTIAQPTLTPDSEGEWVAKCTVTLAGQTAEFIHTVRVGVPVAASGYSALARVLVDLDFKTIGALGTISLRSSGNADYAVGGATIHASKGGAYGEPDTCEVNANGLVVAKAGGTTGMMFTLGLSDDYAVSSGDFFVVQVSIEPISMQNTNFAAVGITDDEETANGANSMKIIFVQNGAGDYDARRQVGIGTGTLCADLSAALPTNVQLTLMGRGGTFVGQADLDASMPDPTGTTAVASFSYSLGSATKDYSSGQYGCFAGGLHAFWWLVALGELRVSRVRALMVRL